MRDETFVLHDPFLVTLFCRVSEVVLDLLHDFFALNWSVQALAVVLCRDLTNFEEEPVQSLHFRFPLGVGMVEVLKVRLLDYAHNDERLGHKVHERL